MEEAKKIWFNGKFVKKKFILLILSLFVILAGFVWQGVYLPKNSAADSGVSGEEEIFLIKKGETVKEIAFNLEEQGLIRNRFSFLLYVFFNGSSKNLKAGGYLLNSSMAVPEITKKIISGDTLKEKITIIEGWSLKDAGLYFEDKGLFEDQEFFKIAGYPLQDYPKDTAFTLPEDFFQQFDFLRDKPKSAGLEGYLFPDTYYIERGSGAKEIVKKLLGNFDKKLTPELRKKISEQKRTIFKIVTMASLIEKEVRSIEDKKVVSGILWKRLKVGMPLQVDATIAYITGKRTTKISREETKYDSLYNTYKYPGLPKGPICNPGIESIVAAIYPENNEFWYYLSTPEGITIFSRTLQEHNVAKAKYL